MRTKSKGPFVFISYAHKDNDIVLPIIRELEKQNVNLWYDDGIEAGSEWPEFIAQKILACDRFICFISEAYIHSKNCTRELNYVLSNDRPVLSVHIDNAKLSPGIAMQLGTNQSMIYERFSGSLQFASALCQEPFLEPCVIKKAEPQPKPAATQPNPATTQPKTAATQPNPANTPPKTAATQPKKPPQKLIPQKYRKAITFIYTLVAIAGIWYVINLLNVYPSAPPSFKYAFIVWSVLTAIGLAIDLFFVSLWDKSATKYKKLLFIVISLAVKIILGWYVSSLVLNVSFLFHLLTIVIMLVAHVIIELIMFFATVLADSI